MDDMETFDLNTGDEDPVDYNLEARSEPAMPDPMEFDVDEPAVRPRTRSAKKEADMSYDDKDDQTKHQNLLLQCQRFANSPRFGAWLKTWIHCDVDHRAAEADDRGIGRIVE